MATRIPYTASDEDIYSQLMAQFAQAQPYYSAPTYSGGYMGGGFMGDGLLGGYDPGLYSMPAAAAPMTASTGYMGRREPQYDMSLSGETPVPGNIGNAYGPNGLPNMVTSALVPIANALNIYSPFQGLITGGLPGAVLGNAAQQAQNTNMSLIAESNSNEGATVPNGLTSAEQAAIDAMGSYGESVAPGGAPAPGAPDGGYGAYGENVAPSGDGGGGGGGKIICTKLYHLGKMPKEIFEADQAFGEILVRMQPDTYAGYVVWAKHVVRWMSREDFIGKTVVAITNAIATPWSIAMAEEMGVNVKSSWFGRFLLKRGLQFCAFVGGMTKKEGLQNV